MHVASRPDNMRDVLLHEHPSERVPDCMRLVMNLVCCGGQVGRRTLQLDIQEKGRVRRWVRTIVVDNGERTIWILGVSSAMDAEVVCRAPKHKRLRPLAPKTDWPRAKRETPGVGTWRSTLGAHGWLRLQRFAASGCPIHLWTSDSF